MKDFLNSEGILIVIGFPYLCITKPPVQISLRKGNNFKNTVVSQDNPRLTTYLDPMIKSMATSLHHDFQKYSDASRNITFGKCCND